MRTIDDSKTSLNNLREGLLTLHDGFAIIDEREKNQKFVEFKISFLRLITAVKKAQENGLWRKTYFNIFESLGYQRLEAVHSNILAWLLNPDEAHGLGDEFLRAFVWRIFNEKLPSHFPIKIRQESQYGENRFDIVVEGDNWWLVIENKIDSEEQEGQTKKYAEIYGKKGKIEENVFLVYLSPYGEPAESIDFTPVSYRIIRELLERMSSVQNDADFLIRHFRDHIYLELENLEMTNETFEFSSPQFALVMANFKTVSDVRKVLKESGKKEIKLFLKYIRDNLKNRVPELKSWENPEIMGYGIYIRPNAQW